ncbi:MAG TPA: hypothetical protein VJH20_01015 [Candidatus Nanoarchaeia archaeon]|nr:hypothetical protein [Candidatus Nanoarchaeia archaeon]
MDIKKDFNKSFNALKKNKVIIAPILISMIIPLLLAYLYIQITGVYGLLSDSANDIRQGGGGLVNTEIVKEIFALENLTWLLIFILIGSIILFYLSCVSLALITMNVLKKELNFHNMINLANKYLFKFLTLNVLMFLIMMAPVLTAIIIIILIFIISNMAGVISLIFAIILSISYFIFIFLRLLFVNPVMFIENKSATKSIAFSYQITKHHLRQVLIIYAIIIGITIISNIFIVNPLNESYISFIASDSLLKSIAMVILIFLFLIIESFVYALEQLFLFYSYIDFRRGVKL